MSKNRKIISALALLLLIVSNILNHFLNNSFSNYLMMFTMIILGIIMFVWSGNDSDWLIEKTIIKKFRRKV